ncbi:sugar phosphate nucleotidyltransferase [Paradesulfitobacterium aromaticivorans]
MQVVILAGGRGSRLDPFTRILPKPLFPIGNEPLASILVRQLRGAGAEEIVMSLGYLSQLIIAYFQDGSRFGLPVRYVVEGSPLGTAGSLKTIENLAEDFLVVNGDELTTLNFRALYDHHMMTDADMTIAVQKKAVPSSLGVLDIQDGQVVAYREKPTLNFWVSMGIYVLSKPVVQLIPDGRKFDMPELVQNLLQEQARIVSYECDDLWFDIGTMEDLEKARKVFGSSIEGI